MGSGLGLVGVVVVVDFLRLRDGFGGGGGLFDFGGRGFDEGQGARGEFDRVWLAVGRLDKSSSDSAAASSDPSSSMRDCGFEPVNGVGGWDE